MNNERMIDRIVHLMETDKSADAPAESLKWAKNIFKTRAVQPQATLIEKIFAVLQMDLAPNRAVFGERSGSASAVRQMLFSAGDNSIDLRIAGEKSKFNVAGQILGAGFGGATIRLENASNTYQIEAGQLSEFRFTNIAPGNYRLVARGAAKEIIIDGIEVG